MTHAAVLAAAAGCAAAAPPPPDCPTPSPPQPASPCAPRMPAGRHLVETDACGLGGHRQWLLVVPEGVSVGSPAVMMLHGMGGSPQYADAWANFSAYVAARKWVGVLPYGTAAPGAGGVEQRGATACCDDGCNATCCADPRTTGSSTNANLCAWDVAGGAGFPGQLGNTHDVAFLRYVAGWLAGAQCTDASRLFVMGDSAGAMMTNRFACEAAELVRGVGTAMGSAMVDCAPSRPVPFVQLCGTADIVCLNSPDGQSPVPGERPPEPVGAFYGNVHRWAERNGCNISSVNNASRGSAPLFQQSVEAAPAVVTLQTNTSRCRAFTGCAAPTSYCTVDGLGHEWAGHAEPGCPGGSGCPDRGVFPTDADATAQIFGLFDSLAA